MEIHRLKPMKEGYSPELFNRLYKETEKLRNSLVHNIDHRRFGVSKDIIKSWFDDKFIFVFNKHFEGNTEGDLKGLIINSLQNFKYRVLRGAYTKQSEFYTSAIELEGESKLINYLPDSSDIDNEGIFMGLVTEFFKKELSDDAFMLFNLQMHPPLYILNRIPKSNSPIPLNLILEFFDLDDIHKNIKYIRRLKQEIQLATKKAREEFNPTPALV